MIFRGRYSAKGLLVWPILLPYRSQATSPEVAVILDYQVIVKLITVSQFSYQSNTMRDLLPLGQF